MIPIVSVVGKSNSGKTTLIVALIGELKRRGYKVAVIKHSGNEVEPDTVKKDTWRFTQAGSEVSAITTASRFALFKNIDRPLSPQELYYLTGWDYDLVLAEGYKHSRFPKIEVHRREFGPELVIPRSELLALVTDEPLDVPVPQFNKDDIGGIADVLEKLVVACPQHEIDITADGVPLEISDHLKDVLFRTVTAMLSGAGGPLPGDVHVRLRRRA